ncbi:Transcriptional regulatory protein WalR [bioreactor metagenome]|uniref:Transcriptional regulatory protein WalR n=1 Tax=bioreactor metagenome TaxID=1076179 RepID=A0A645BVE5_9ZZZZ|nr:response regulator transcription factor [Candidatus Metalachnospira sp.]
MIYLLEDDESIRNFVEYALNNSGLESCGFEKPSDFYKAVSERIPQLVILDVMLPEEDGLEVLKKLRNRSETKKLPVIMLTAKDSEYDKVIGLDSGADDYVAKPFGMMELISRIKALMRRLGNETKKDEYTIDGLYVCPSKHIVKANGNEVVLTYKEFELLCLLISNRGTVFSRDQILRSIWGFEFDGENRTVDVHIRTLRTKLGECGSLVETVRGIGYKIGG